MGSDIGLYSAGMWHNHICSLKYLCCLLSRENVLRGSDRNGKNGLLMIVLMPLATGRLALGW